MTTCIIFCLSYVLSKELFIAFKVNVISTKHALFISDVMTLLFPVENDNICVVITSLMTRHYPLNNSEVM